MHLLGDNQWQTPAALAVVAITLVAFAVRLARRKRSNGAGKCDSGCGCDPGEKLRTPGR